MLGERLLAIRTKKNSLDLTPLCIKKGSNLGDKKGADAP